MNADDKVTKLFHLSGANMQSTADQQFSRIGAFTAYKISDIFAREISGGTTISCVGGIYTSPAKGGNILVAAAQSWLGLTGAGKIVTSVLTALVATDEQTATPYLSLTTGSTGACIADLVIFGYQFS